MRDKLIIIGAGGHGKVCREIAELNGYKDIIVLDDNLDNGIAFGKTSLFSTFTDDSDFFVAIGNNQTRKEYIQKIISYNGTLVTLVHPNAVVSKKATLGYGTVVMAGAIINPSAIIANGVIVNTSSSIDHDCHIDSFCHICVGAHLAGSVYIGEESFIGAGATVINNIVIKDKIIVGAGATVIKNLNEQGIYVGVPALKIK